MPNARARLANAWPIRPMPTIPSRFPVMRRPSIQVGAQPAQCPSGMICEPSTSRRAVERISAMVMSAVSSVSTPGVLVTVIPRLSALVTSIWSTPLPKFAISFICSPAWATIAALIVSVMVGTRTSASRIASTISAWDIGLSSRFKRASNSSRIRVSTSSGSRRVTTTKGFFLVMSALPAPARPSRHQPFASAPSNRLRLINAMRRRCFALGTTRRVRAAGSPASLSEGGAKTRMGDNQGNSRLNRNWPRRLTRRQALPILAALTVAPHLALADPQGPVTKLPLPRYASLKTDRVNLREGPSKDHPTKWVYQRAGLPVEITAEFEIWRKVRDSEGVEGWVLHSLLSGRRTALVTPSRKAENSQIYVRPSDRADLAATLQSGVIVNVRNCDGAWCQIDGEGFKGYIRQVKLWGVYPNEKIE